MTREEFMQEARLTAHKILAHKENGIMNLVQHAWAECKRSVAEESGDKYIEGALAVKRAVDMVLDIMSYDAKGLFDIHNEKMAVDKIRGMSASDIIDAAKKIDEWKDEATGGYDVGMIVRDPLRQTCVITKIYTGRTADIMGGFHVLYADGDTNRWPLGTKFEPLRTDSGLFDDLVGGIRDADEADKEEREA